MRYTYSEDEDRSDGGSGRRSARNSGISTPLETGPTVTASGRQVKSRVGGVYGESMLLDQRKELDRAAGEDHYTETSEDMPTTIPKGRAARTSRSGREVKPPRPRYGDSAGTDGTDGTDESDEAQSSGKEWSGDENEPDVSEPDFDGEDEEEDEDMDDEDVEAEEDEITRESLVVQLRYRKGGQQPTPTTSTAAQSLQPLQPRPQQHLSSNDNITVVTNGSNSANPLPQAPATEQAISDTIDVAPRTKLGNGTNGTKPAYHHLLLAPRPVVEITTQPMDVS